MCAASALEERGCWCLSEVRGTRPPPPAGECAARFVFYLWRRGGRAGNGISRLIVWLICSRWSGCFALAISVSIAFAVSASPSLSRSSASLMWILASSFAWPICICLLSPYAGVHVCRRRCVHALDRKMPAFCVHASAHLRCLSCTPQTREIT